MTSDLECKNFHVKIIVLIVVITFTDPIYYIALLTRLNQDEKGSSNLESSNGLIISCANTICYVTITI